MSLLQAVAPVLIGVGIALFITVKVTYEVFTNNRRIRRGEPPKKYHDVADGTIVNVIDWTRK